MSLTSGSRLGSYEILAPLGAGGMGEVYRARDTRLNREVALKVLPTELAADPDRLDRFEREGKTLAALDHPNIVQIFSVEESEGVRFLTMQLIEGTSLKDRIPAGGAPADRWLAIAIALADALRAAHEKGIVHRDLKPGNVMLDTEDRIKVLDFGLAKVQAAMNTGDSSERPTEAMTSHGVVLGTLPYMSPQQADGKPLDHRTDIFSLGVILYELATGQRPFRGDSPASLVSSILRDQPPPVTDVNEKLPAEVAEIVARCLEKDPDRRFQSAKELCDELRAVDERRAYRHKGAGVSVGWPLVAALLLAGLVYLFRGGVSEVDNADIGAERPQFASLAVLPLDNLSRDREQEYFVDGMTDALITDLSQLGGIKVISRSSSMRYRDSTKSAPEIAEELGVDVLLEGSVIRENDMVAVNAQLISAADGQSLWARRYQREFTNVLALHADLAEAIATEIAYELTPEQRLRLGGERPVNPTTYEGYLRGMHEIGKGTSDGYEAGIRHLQAALDADPADPLAYAGLALGYIRIGHDNGPPHVAFPRASAAARRALELDATLAEAHLALADAQMYYEWDWPAAKASFERAVELNRSLAEAHAHYAWWYVMMGRWEEAVTEAELAVEYDPLSAEFTSWLARIEFVMGDYDAAIEHVERTFELNPDEGYGWLVLASVYRSQGRFDDAIEIVLERLPHALGFLASTYAMAGRPDDARRTLETLDENASASAAHQKAVGSASLGDIDGAFQALELSYEKRSRRMPWMGTNPAFVPLRQDPRFGDFLQRMNLPDGRSTLPGSLS